MSLSLKLFLLFYWAFVISLTLARGITGPERLRLLAFLFVIVSFPCMAIMGFILILAN